MPIPTKETFKSWTDAGMFKKRSNAELVAIDDALQAYQDTNEDARTLDMLKNLKILVEKWLLAKETKIATSGAESVTRLGGVVRLYNEIVNAITDDVNEGMERQAELNALQRESLVSIAHSKIEYGLSTKAKGSLVNSRGREDDNINVFQIKRKHDHSVLQEYTEAIEGPPPVRADGEDEDTNKAIEIGKQALTLARKLLPNGPLNNRLGGVLPSTVLNRLTYPRAEYWRAFHIAGALSELDEITSLDFSGLDYASNDLLQSLTMAYAVKQIGGGVCSQIASLTGGILSTIAPSGTQFCMLAHNADHQFCVVAYNTSTWFIVDPWTHYSSVIPWADGYFNQSGVVQHIHATISEPVADMYGFKFDSTMLQNIADDFDTVFTPTNSDKEVASPWGHSSNVAACYPDGDFVSSRTHDVDQNAWG